LELVQQTVRDGIPFRAVVADSFYGENETFRTGLHDLGVGYVLALRPSHAWWAPVDTITSLAEAAQAARWDGPEAPGDRQPVVRTFRDGHTAVWWALEVQVGPYGPGKRQRVVIATSDPATLPDLTTWYLVTNLPAPDRMPTPTTQPPADVAEVVRLYGLRNWVEQSYKQVKQALGWRASQVRSDRAMRRHWSLVCCAFSFCWWAADQNPAALAPPPAARPVRAVAAATEPAARGEKAAAAAATPPVVAAGPAPGASVAGTVGYAAALLAGVVGAAPTTGATAPLGAGRPGLSAPALR
jgi:SRSO17 transposase